MYYIYSIYNISCSLYVALAPYCDRIRLPDWVRSQNLDPTIYPLLPSLPKARKSIANLERFLSLGVSEQNGQALLDSHLVEPRRLNNGCKSLSSGYRWKCM